MIVTTTFARTSGFRHNKTPIDGLEPSVGVTIHTAQNVAGNDLTRGSVLCLYLKHYSYSHVAWCSPTCHAGRFELPGPHLNFQLSVYLFRHHYILCCISKNNSAASRYRGTDFRASIVISTTGLFECHGICPSRMLCATLYHVALQSWL